MSGSSNRLCRREIRSQLVRPDTKLLREAAALVCTSWTKVYELTRAGVPFSERLARHTRCLNSDPESRDEATRALAVTIYSSDLRDFGGQAALA
jgi:hypothetical protein